MAHLYLEDQFRRKFLKRPPGIAHFSVNYQTNLACIRDEEKFSSGSPIKLLIVQYHLVLNPLHLYIRHC